MHENEELAFFTRLRKSIYVQNRLSFILPSGHIVKGLNSPTIGSESIRRQLDQKPPKIMISKLQFKASATHFF